MKQGDREQQRVPYYQYFDLVPFEIIQRYSYNHPGTILERREKLIVFPDLHKTEPLVEDFRLPSDSLAMPRLEATDFGNANAGKPRPLHVEAEVLRCVIGLPAMRSEGMR